MNTFINENAKNLLAIRQQHREEVMERFNKKFKTHREVLDNEHLLDAHFNREQARKLFMKEVDFIKYVVNKEGRFTSNKLDEQLTENFYIQKVGKEEDKTVIVMTCDARKTFDRGIYAVVIERGKLSFNVLNMKEKTMRMIDSINLPVMVKQTPLQKKLEKAKKKVARKYKDRMLNFVVDCELY